MTTRFVLTAFYILGFWTALFGTPSFCQTQKPELVVQVGHTESTSAVSFSPNGKTLASGSNDGSLKLWDVASGQLIRSFKGQANRISSVAFSPDGRTLASFSNDIKLWDITNGRLLRTIPGQTNGVSSVTFSPDGRTLASGDGIGRVKIWDAASGRLLCTLKHHTGKVAKEISTMHSLPASNGDSWSWSIENNTGKVAATSFSPDGKTLASGGFDHTVKLWDVVTGHPIRTFLGHTKGVNSVSFSPDGATLVSGSYDKSIKLWDVATGKLLRTLTEGNVFINSVSFSPDGKTIASSGYENVLRLWEVSSGRLIRTLPASGYISVDSISFSPDGKTIASDGDGGVTLYDISTGKLLPPLAGNTNTVFSMCFALDGKTFVSMSDSTVNLWSASTSSLRQNSVDRATYTSPSGMTITQPYYLNSLSVSPDGKFFAVADDSKAFSTGDRGGTIAICDTETGKLRRTLIGHTTTVAAVAFSPDDKTLASGSLDNSIRLWDATTGKPLLTLTGEASFVCFSPDGKTLASGGDKTVKLWEVTTGNALRTLTDVGGFMRFSPDGKTLASGSKDNSIKLLDITTGKLLRTFAGHTGGITSVTFSPDGRTLASSSSDVTIKIWDVSTGRLLRTLRQDGAKVVNLSFSPDGKTLASGNDNGSIHYMQVTGQDICTLYVFDKEGWAVVSPDGRFDGNDAGLQSLHYVAGLEPIDLAQLKSRYYEPGLLGKLLGFNKEPLRNVSAFDHVELYPAVQTPPAVADDGKLKLTLTNQGGGIGRVQIFVNGKELNADARGPKPDPDAKTAEVIVDVSHAPGLVPGQPNTVKVVTWNAEGYLSSRGVECVYTPPGLDETRPPELWAIVGGISDYAGPGLHLTYPAKDAADFAGALALGAKRLFGTGKVHLTLLDSGGQPGALAPTKANLQAAFADARQAKPGDIFVVYLAGHGIALPGTLNASDLYCYLTADATTGSPADLSADTQLRQATTVSSEELTDWIKQIPARKQVMILDTCAAGAAARSLVEKRDIPGDQIRAIDRLKDRTGFYVLMGCTADAVSYETSRYRQGLLTYSLLKGMKGASLRDGQYVDVGGLFNYAVDEVPRLAQDIGGVQRPFVAAPSAGSFDVGELSAVDRQAIPLASAGVMLLRPELVADDEDLGLEALLVAKLRDVGAASARGDASVPALSFLDVSDFPGALRPQGTYTVVGQTITAKLRLYHDGQVVKTVQVLGTRTDLPGLVSKLSAAIVGAIGTP